MKKFIIAALAKTFLLVLLSSSVMAQVGIGTITPAASAQLDVVATNKGVLIPRMAASARTGIASPATGLLVYQTDAPTGFWYFNGTQWVQLGLSGVTSGFAAALTGSTIAASGNLTGWSTAAPNFTTGGFNTTTGEFTVPETGTYAITATINYKTTAALSVSLGAGVDPAFEIARTAPVATTLLSGNMPILNVNVILVLTLRAVLGNGTVTMAGTANLTAGDVVVLRYNADGLAVNLDLTPANAGIVQWSMTKL